MTNAHPSHRLRGFIAALSIWLAIGAAPSQAKENLDLKSTAVLVVDQETGESVISKNADLVMPIASLTKLMTALVVLDAKLPMEEMLEVTSDDIDREKHSTSRLPVGTRLSRANMLLLALMASENRAATSLSRSYPGGSEAFIVQMNKKATSLGMKSTQFLDPSGLSYQNVSTARDLLRLVSAADTQDLIRRYTTQPEATFQIRKQRLKFVNTNRMVRNAPDWDIGLQKTGFTNDAGRCLVMRATTLDRKLSMVFLNSVGKLTRFADAARVRKQLKLDAKSSRSSTREATKASAAAGAAS